MLLLLKKCSPGSGSGIASLCLFVSLCWLNLPIATSVGDPSLDGHNAVAAVQPLQDDTAGVNGGNKPDIQADRLKSVPAAAVVSPDGKADQAVDGNTLDQQKKEGTSSEKVSFV